MWEQGEVTIVFWELQLENILGTFDPNLLLMNWHLNVNETFKCCRYKTVYVTVTGKALGLKHEKKDQWNKEDKASQMYVNEAQL